MIDINKKEPSWFLGILGAICLYFIISFMFLYFHFVSVGEWITRENYSSNSEFLKQVGLFLATMMGFYIFFEIYFEFFMRLPIFYKSKEAI